jgi:hypothetical protein
LEVNMEFISRLLGWGVVVVAMAPFGALAAWLAVGVLDEAALEECQLLQREAHQYGDVRVPDWCAEVPGFRQ